jgi:CheY-like chemotaxis protein
MLTRIFDMFVQGEAADGAQDGLGIGLALSHKLIEMQGGTIEAHSDGLGEGSEFIIRLPLVEQAGADPVVNVSQGPVPVSRRILVVDDNVDAAESIAAILRIAGHEARTAHNGATALSLAESWLPDVVVLDIGLPDLDGYQVARQLRARSGSKCPELMALSGWGGRENRLRATEAGFDSHYTKPIDPELLIRILAERLPRMGADTP